MDQGTKFAATPSGIIDTPALLEIASHLNAVQPSAWTNMTASGEFAPVGGVPSKAELVVSGSSYVSLTMASTSGVQRMVSSDGATKISFADAPAITFTDQGWTPSFLHFPMLRISSFSKRLTGLKDGGRVFFEGQSLHKLSAHFAGTAVHQDGTPVTEDTIGQIDFYFDPVTHLLLKTVNPVRLPGSVNAVLQVMTYSAYKPVDLVMVPFQMQQSIDGQPQWTLTLSGVSFPLTLDPTTLTF